MGEAMTLIFVLSILFFSVVFAVGIYFFQRSYMQKVMGKNKSDSRHSTSLQDASRGSEKIQESSKEVWPKYSVWEGIKLGFGFVIGATVAFTIYAILSAMFWGSLSSLIISDAMMHGGW